MAETAEDPGTRRRAGKSAEAFRTISEVAQELDLPQHVLRFWETKFPQVRPMKRGGGRRYYRPEDMVLLRRIRELLYADGYTIRGVQKLLKENGAKGLIESAPVAAVAGPNAKTATPDLKHELEAILRELEEMRRILEELRS